MWPLLRRKKRNCERCPRRFKTDEVRRNALNDFCHPSVWNQPVGPSRRPLDQQSEKLNHQSFPWDFFHPDDQAGVEETFSSSVPSSEVGRQTQSVPRITKTCFMSSKVHPEGLPSKGNLESCECRLLDDRPNCFRTCIHRFHLTDHVGLNLFILIYARFVLTLKIFDLLL